jgi:hypothetical protein
MPTGLKMSRYGGVVQSVNVFDSKGSKSVDVTLGFDDGTEYCSNSEHPYFGALIGRVANRIADGEFTLNGGQTYNTPINEPAPAGGNDTLHGGTLGFDRRVWAVTTPAANTAVLTLDSADGEQGFPGHLGVTVTYTLEPDAADSKRRGGSNASATTWWIDYEATLAPESTVDTVYSKILGMITPISVFFCHRVYNLFAHTHCFLFFSLLLLMVILDHRPHAAHVLEPQWSSGEIYNRVLRT